MRVSCRPGRAGGERGKLCLGEHPGWMSLPGAAAVGPLAARPEGARGCAVCASAKWSRLAAMGRQFLQRTFTIFFQYDRISCC